MDGGMQSGSPQPTPLPNLAPPEGGDARGDFESRMGYNETDMPSFIPDDVRSAMDDLMKLSDKGGQDFAEVCWRCAGSADEVASDAGRTTTAERVALVPNNKPPHIHATQ